MSIIQKISEKLFGKKETEVDRLVNIKNVIVASQETLQFQIAESVRTSKNLKQNLNALLSRQNELKDKAKQFIINKDETSARVALQKKGLLTTELNNLNSSLKSEMLYQEQLKKLFAELETRIIDLNSTLKSLKMSEKRANNRSSSTTLLTEIGNIEEFESFAQTVLAKAKRDDFMGNLELDTDCRLANDSVSNDEEILIDEELKNLKIELSD